MAADPDHFLDRVALFLGEGLAFFAAAFLGAAFFAGELKDPRQMSLVSVKNIPICN